MLGDPMTAEERSVGGEGIARTLIFGGLSVGFFAILLYLVLWPIEWSNGRAAAALVGAVTCGVFSYLHRIKSFKVSLASIEAQLREAERVVISTRATLHELHEFAEIISSIVVSQLMGAGRWDGYGPAEIEKTREEIRAGLISIGLDPAKADRVLESDSRFVEIDYAIGVLQAIRAQPEPHSLFALTLLDRWNKESWRPTPDELAQIVSERGITDQAMRELIEDYRYYVATKRHRRPDVWLNRENWPGTWSR